MTSQLTLPRLPDKPAILSRMARAFSHARNTRAVGLCLDALRRLGCDSEGKPRRAA